MLPVTMLIQVGGRNNASITAELLAQGGDYDIYMYHKKAIYL